MCQSLGRSLGQLAPVPRERERTHNHAAVDADDVFEPGLCLELEVCIAQDLEAVPVVVSGLALLALVGRGVAIEAGYEAVEGVEHGGDSGLFDVAGRCGFGEFEA